MSHCAKIVPAAITSICDLSDRLGSELLVVERGGGSWEATLTSVESYVDRGWGREWKKEFR